MELVNLSIELWVAPDEKSGKLRYAWASKLLASNAAFKLADAVLIFVYPLPVKSEFRADRTEGDAGGDGESSEMIASIAIESMVPGHLKIWNNAQTKRKIVTKIE